ncbi:hypothetical protein BDW62DRAFT_216829 [Aspergillus aurantiobrunneus]
MAGDKGYTPKEDRVVRDELAKLGEKIRNWAKKYSAASLEDLSALSGKEQEAVIKQLRRFTSQADWDALIGSMPFSQSKIPALLVQALLARDIFERIFGDPFFAFTRLECESTLPDSKEMMRVYFTMGRINETDAHIWRSQTLQNLSKSSGPETKSFVQQRLDSICSKLPSNFVSGPAGVLLRPVKDGGGSTPREKELYALYNGAAQLASCLWMQRTYIICQSQQHLPVFNVANPAMSAHRLHQLDEDEIRLDGKRTLLVVQPAIVALGSEDAEHYDRRKVWAPAIVVVGER